MVYFLTKNANLGKFWKLFWYFVGPFSLFHSQLTYSMPIWYIWWSFGTFGGHLVHLVVIWYIPPRLGMFYREKSGNPEL
jgi:hypothetical protein